MKRGFVDGEYQDGEVRGLVFLAGKRGMGKTTEVIRLLRSCSGGVLFFDTKAKHAHLMRDFALVHEPGQLKDAIRRAPGRFRIIYQPLRGAQKEHFEACNDIVQIVGDMVYAVDEVDYHTCSSIERVKENTPKFYDLIEYGRHFHVAMLGTFRKPANVARGMTSEYYELRLFRTTENIYVKYWVDTIGDTQAAELLRKLPKYQYLLCRDGDDPVIMSAGRLVGKKVLGTR